MKSSRAKKNVPSTQAEDPNSRHSQSPNWSRWRQVREIRIFEAVALSLNQEPAEISHWAEEMELTWETLPYMVTGGSKEMEDRLFVALRNLDTKDGIRPSKKNPNHFLTKVYLDEFATWAASAEWQIPLELTRLSNSPHLFRWPWGTHTTKLLEALAGAASKFWSEYDPNNPPKSVDVENWLEDQGVAFRNAKVMATMLRPDGLPPGKRRATMRESDSTPFPD